MDAVGVDTTEVTDSDAILLGITADTRSSTPSAVNVAMYISKGSLLD
jgi:hypothetical protein